MTDPAALLRRLHAPPAFEPTPLREGLAAYHVPFDELTARRTTEQALAAAVRSGSQVSVSGLSGVGKSSLLAHVLAGADDELLVCRVPVEAEDDDVVREPAAFCRHVLGVLSQQLVEAERITLEQRRGLLARGAPGQSLSRGRTRSAGGRLAGWLLSADVRQEVRSVVDSTLQPSGADAVATVARLFAVAHAAGRQPVLVVDDSDAWLSRPGGRDRSGLVAPFFGRVLRTVADELPTALVVAVHDEYRERSDYPAATGYLTSDIAVPRLPGPDALARVLAARLRFESGVELADVFAEPALALLWQEHVQHGPSIRQAMLRAHTAIQVAVDLDAGRVQAAHVTAAGARYG